ncbi:MAG: nucleoside deaminase [Muribaculaceae bacterium]|nr:nucleoside deaminase [Muribaculaceae bacterium]
MVAQAQSFISSLRSYADEGATLKEQVEGFLRHIGVTDAEMQAITAAVGTLGGKYLPECTLYVTVEPCIMCAGAIAWSQLRRIVYGAADNKRGYTTIVRHAPFHPKATVTPGVLSEECASLMKTFFARKR